MNAYELINVFHNAVTLNSEVMFGYVGLMSGFLVMSYLVADKLPALLAGIVLVLFSVVSLLLAFRLYLNGGDAAAVMEYMKARESMGSLDLGGFGDNPPWSGTVVPFLEMASILGGYIGCVIFFVYRRRTGHQKDN